MRSSKKLSNLSRNIMYATFEYSLYKLFRKLSQFVGKRACLTLPTLESLTFLCFTILDASRVVVGNVSHNISSNESSLRVIV